MRQDSFALAACLLASAWSTPAAAQAPDGAGIFKRECATCHTGAPDTRAPAPEVLGRRSPEAILSALTAGSMRPQGGRLNGAERRAVAEFITGRSLGGDITGASVGRCSAVSPLNVVEGAPAWPGWSRRANISARGAGRRSWPGSCPNRCISRPARPRNIPAAG